MSQFSTFAFSQIGCNSRGLYWKSDISDAVVVGFCFFFNSATISNVIISILTL